MGLMWLEMWVNELVIYKRVYYCLIGNYRIVFNKGVYDDGKYNVIVYILFILIRVWS